MGLANSLHAVLTRSGATRRSQECEVWWVKDRFFRPSSQLKYEVLSAFRTSGLSLAIAHDDPADEEVPGPWERTAEGWWILPAGFQPGDQAAQRWLGLGAWCLCPLPCPRERPDLIRASPREVSAFLADNSLEAVVGSFHDNDPWVVAYSKS